MGLDNFQSPKLALQSFASFNISLLARISTVQNCSQTSPNSANHYPITAINNGFLWCQRKQGGWSHSTTLFQCCLRNLFRSSRWNKERFYCFHFETQCKKTQWPFFGFFSSGKETQICRQAWQQISQRRRETSYSWSFHFHLHQTKGIRERTQNEAAKPSHSIHLRRHWFEADTLYFLRPESNCHFQTYNRSHRNLHWFQADSV